MLGTGGSDPLTPVPLSAGRGRAAPDELRKGLAGSNVLLIILDAGRAQQFGCYGYPRATTPEIDRIAAEGVVFERVYTPSVYTLGAMSSLWTSQYPDRHHGDVSFNAKLPKDRLTLAELLSAQGIHTGGFVANAVAGRLFGFDRGFADFHEVLSTLGSSGARLPAGRAAVARGRTATGASSRTSTSASRTSRTTPSRRSTRSSGPTARSRRPTAAARRSSGT